MKQKYWNKVKFGDIAENIAIRVDPSQVDTDIYVGLEHLDPESIHLKNWGHPSEVTGQKLAFKKGDVIFGRRRAYQRKLALAEFDGICSAHAIVLRAKPEMILPEFIPFFLKSDMFMDRAIKISVGSLSPTINWKTLKIQKFRLPPLSEQKRIAEILWAADEAVFAFENVLKNFVQFIRLEIECKLKSLDCKKLKLSQVLIRSPESGCSSPPSTKETGHWVLSLSALSVNGYCKNNLKPVKKSSKMMNARLYKGDLLISRSNTVELVGLVGIFNEDRDDVSFPDTMMRLPVNKELIFPEYLEIILLSSLGRKHMMKIASGTSGSMKKINRRTLSEFCLPVPNVTKQENIIADNNHLKNQYKLTEKILRRIQDINLSLINNEIGATHV